MNHIDTMAQQETQNTAELSKTLHQRLLYYTHMYISSPFLQFLSTAILLNFKEEPSLKASFSPHVIAQNKNQSAFLQQSYIQIWIDLYLLALRRKKTFKLGYYLAHLKYGKLSKSGHLKVLEIVKFLKLKKDLKISPFNLSWRPKRWLWSRRRWRPHIFLPLYCSISISISLSF